MEHQNLNNHSNHKIDNNTIDSIIYEPVPGKIEIEKNNFVFNISVIKIINV
jgi:hypothetical protein